MSCQQCAHWSLKDSPLRSEGFGFCKADKSQFAKSRTFSGTNDCRFNQFVQAAPAVVVARERALA